MAGPTLTQNLDANPFVEVFFDAASLHPDAAELRVWRFSEDRQWKVRGGWDIAIGTPALDWEVPFRSLATYRAEQFTAGGATLGFTESSATTVNVSGTWVHNPLEPSAGVFVEVDDESARELSRPTPGSIVRTEGGSVPRRIGSRRRGLEGVDVVLNVDGLDRIAAFEAALGDYGTDQQGVLCVRTADPVMWPRTFFAAADAWPKTDKTVRTGGDWVQFRASCDEVEPPAPGVVAPFLRYSDLDAAYPSLAARDGRYGAYSAQDRDYSLVGVAG